MSGSVCPGGTVLRFATAKCIAVWILICMNLVCATACSTASALLSLSVWCLPGPFVWGLFFACLLLVAIDIAALVYAALAGQIPRCAIGILLAAMTAVSVTGWLLVRAVAHAFAG